MKKSKLLKKVLAGWRNTRFSDAKLLAESFGFSQVRVSGSHHIFGHAGIQELVNLQNVGGKAKPYQIKQLLRLVERYDLKQEEDDE